MTTLAIKQNQKQSPLFSLNEKLIQPLSLSPFPLFLFTLFANSKHDRLINTLYSCGWITTSYCSSSPSYRDKVSCRKTIPQQVVLIVMNHVAKSPAHGAYIQDVQRPKAASVTSSSLPPQLLLAIELSIVVSTSTEN